MRKAFLALMALTFVGGFWSCKPTERNYKAAYDAAVEKRTKVDADLGLSAGSLTDESAPRKIQIGGDSVYMAFDKLTFIDGLEHSQHRYCVAVGAYKMSTNCSAHVSALFTKGYQAFAAKGANGLYYAIAGSFKNAEEAVAFINTFKSREPKEGYIGLPGAPVLIDS